MTESQQLLDVMKEIRDEIRKHNQKLDALFASQNFQRANNLPGAKPTGWMEHGGFRYRLSGEQDMFIQRFPAGGQGK
jgi:hypothetical protein